MNANNEKPIYDKPENEPKNFLDEDLSVNDNMAKPRELCPTGMKQIVITHVVPAGTHLEHFPPKPATTVKKVLCLFEISARKLDGKRFVGSRKWTFSMDEKATMRNDLKGLGIDTSKDFKLKELLGLNGMSNVTHEKKEKGTQVKYGTIAALMEGLPPMKPEGDLATLPEWAQAYIAESAEYKQKYGQGAVGPYATAIKNGEDRKAKYGQGGNAAAPDRGAPPPQAEDDLPF